MKPIVYFYIPVFNEQETAGVLLYRLREVMQKLKFDYMVLLTLDGCSDETPQVVAPYLQLMPVRVVDRSTRLGYCKSLWEAINQVSRESQNPKRDFFIVLDADFTQDPNLLNELSGQVERNVDFCSGNRFAAGQGGFGLSKRLSNLVFPLLLRLKGVRLKDRVDLFTTLRGCRVQLLRRNLRQLKVLNDCGPEVPPAGAGLLLLLLLSRSSRKSYEVRFSEKTIRRRSSRFSIFRLLRFLLFFNFTEALTETREPEPHHPRSRGRRRWKSNKRRPDPSKVKKPV
ncbi:MAG: glycosyltransferase [Candidatus Glassbacteria bacterium]|nr:glycosyltransferase [Candidatus Glassbacteria bacterium]